MNDLADLARLLRELRRRDARQRGGPELTYRGIAAKTGWSHSVIGAYFAGRILPPTDRFDVLIRLLGATSAEQGLFATTRDLVEERRRTGLDAQLAAQVPAAQPAQAPRPDDGIDPARTAAGQVLLERLGPARLAAEPEAVREIIDICGRVPLALRLVAARYASQPRTPLAELVGQLRIAVAQLTGPRASWPDARVMAVLTWTYHQLSPPAARLLRLLGVQPAPGLALPAIASLAGASRDATQASLAELVAAGLAVEQPTERFALHDLVRAYAIELAQRVDGAERLRAAADRLVCHYLYTAEAALRLALPRTRPPHGWARPPEPSAGITVPELTDRSSALAWFSAERPAMVATIAGASGGRHSGEAWRLAWAAETASRPSA